MPLDIEELKDRAWEYVESEAHTTVLGIEFVETFRLLGTDDAAFLVRTSDPEEPEWWVVGGDTAINLYAKSKFATADEAFSFHTGLMIRIMNRDYVESDEEPEDIGYDAFISHASEDKDEIVRPLAGMLKEYGFRIWYDEFALEVGDSLRKSIDRGLVNSRYGIVVLSQAFFRKNWTKYELNSLVAKEVDGKKVILPLWHGVSREDIMTHSPMLADKVAINTADEPLDEIAKKLCRVLDQQE